MLKRKTLKAGFALISAVFALAAHGGFASADIPPAVRFDPPQAGNAKSKPLEVFRGDDSLMPGSERKPGGVLVDTTSYCTAVVDIVANVGAHAKIDVDGSDTDTTSAIPIQEFPPIVIGPQTKKSNFSVVVPMRHRFTSFLVSFFLEEVHGPLLVTVTAIPCTFNLDRW